MKSFSNTTTYMYGEQPPLPTGHVPEYDNMSVNISGGGGDSTFDISSVAFINDIAITLDDDNVETVNHPAHYNPGVYEAINVIEHYNLGFHLGNSVKYILRAGKKSLKVKEDIEKAIWYLERYKEKL